LRQVKPIEQLREKKFAYKKDDRDHCDVHKRQV
jgi:hypothetical protein